MAEEVNRASGSHAADLSWHAAQRWQQLDGELRANMLRIFGLVVFYGIHLCNYYRPSEFFELASKPTLGFHQGVTILVAAWITMAFAIFVVLKQRIFPVAMPYITTFFDIAFLTAMLCMGGGLQSPLVIAYPLLLILAALRFNLTLIRAATAAACFAYLFVVTAAKWPHLIGDRQIGRVPRYSQLMTLAAIGIVGIVLGQLIRRIQTIAEWYANRSEREDSDE